MESWCFMYSRIWTNHSGRDDRDKIMGIVVFHRQGRVCLTTRKKQEPMSTILLGILATFTMAWLVKIEAKPRRRTR